MRAPGGSWIKVIHESEAEGELKEAYAKLRGLVGSYATPGEQPMDVRPGGRVVGPPYSS